jgi:SAM-dependent methyltransferase
VPIGTCAATDPANAVSAPDRLSWVADVVAPAPDEWLLDVGCGHGLLVGALAARLVGGRVVGIDRSPSMITAAARHNEAAVAAGRVRLIGAAFVDADLPRRAFDAVIAVNVRAFWTPPGREWDVVRRVLAPTGRIVIAHNLLSTGAVEPVVDAVERLAAPRGLRLVQVHRAPTRPVPSVALELRRE